MVHPSSHKTPNDISGDVFIFRKICICLTCLLITDSWSVVMFDYSNVIPYVILAVISVDIFIGAIVVVACFYGFIFSPESSIAGMLLLGVLGGVSIQFNKLI